MILVVFALNMIIIFPTLDYTLSWYCQIANAGSTLLVFLTFLFASCKNPGFIKPDKSQHFI